jgi:hypothetical protein
MANVKEESHYKLYLRILDTLKASGYESEELKEKKDDRVSHRILRGGVFQCVVYAVSPSRWATSSSAIAFESCNLVRLEIERKYQRPENFNNNDIRNMNVNDYVTDHSDTGVGAYVLGYKDLPNDKLPNKEVISIIKAVKQGKTPPQVSKQNQTATTGTGTSKVDTSSFDKLTLQQKKEKITKLKQRLEADKAEGKLTASQLQAGVNVLNELIGKFNAELKARKQ